MMIQILKKNPEHRAEKDLNILVPIVREIEFFRVNQIQTHHMVDVCSELRYEKIPAGEFVFYQNDYGDKFYVILKGKVQVLVNNQEYIKESKKIKEKKVKKKSIVTKKMLRPFLADDDADKFSRSNSRENITAADGNNDSKQFDVLLQTPMTKTQRVNLKEGLEPAEGSGMSQRSNNIIHLTQNSVA
jgi:hypothetical protein